MGLGFVGPALKSETAPKQRRNAATEGQKFNMSVQNLILERNVVCMALGGCILRLFRGTFCFQDEHVMILGSRR